MSRFVMACLLVLAIPFSAGFVVPDPSLPGAEAQRLAGALRAAETPPLPRPPGPEISGQAQPGGSVSTMSAPVSAVMTWSEWFDESDSTWKRLEAGSHSGYIPSPWRGQPYRFENAVAGYFRILLSSNSAGYWLNLIKDDVLVAQSVELANRDEIIFRVLDPGVYEVWVRSGSVVSAQPYEILLTAPQFEMRDLTLKIDGAPLPEAAIKFYPPTVVAVSSKTSQSGVLEFYAADTKYSLVVTHQDYGTSALLLFLSVDLVSESTTLPLDTAGLDTVSLHGSDGLGDDLNPPAGYPTVGLEFRKDNETVWFTSRWWEVRTNGGSMRLTYYSLYSEDWDYIWYFTTDTLIDAAQDPMVALGGPLKVNLDIRYYLAPGMEVFPDLLCATDRGDCLELVRRWDGQAWLTNDPVYFIFTPDDVLAAIRGCGVESHFTFPTIADGFCSVVMGWSTGSYAGTLWGEAHICVDTTRPVMSKMEVSPETLSPGGLLSVFADIYDDLSDVEGLSAYFGPVGTSVYESIYNLLRVNMAYESALARYAGQATVPLEAEAGPWELVKARVADRAGNVSNYVAGDFPLATFNVSVTNVIEGDVNGDGRVDLADLAILIQSLGLEASDPGWSGRCDLVPDEVIDIRDLVHLARLLGK